MTERRQPKWQRARLTQDAVPASIRGREVWVKVARPHLDALGRPAFQVHMPCDACDYCGDLKTVSARVVELLARSPADFADDVPLVSYSAWLAGDDGTAQPAGDAAGRIAEEA